jgi:hypothetical protein
MSQSNIAPPAIQPAPPETQTQRRPGRPDARSNISPPAIQPARQKGRRQRRRPSRCSVKHLRLPAISAAPPEGPEDTAADVRCSVQHPPPAIQPGTPEGPKTTAAGSSRCFSQTRRSSVHRHRQKGRRQRRWSSRCSIKHGRPPAIQPSPPETRRQPRICRLPYGVRRGEGGDSARASRHRRIVLLHRLLARRPFASSAGRCRVDIPFECDNRSLPSREAVPLRRLKRAKSEQKVLPVPVQPCGRADAGHPASHDASGAAETPLQ